MDPRAKLVELAQLFVGVKETSPNDGPLIRLFQEAVDAKAGREPYCVGFIQFLLKQVDAEVASEFPSWPGHRLYKTESSIQLWNMSPRTLRLAYPQEGSIIVWQHWKQVLDTRTKKRQDFPMPQGHVGLVVKAVNRETVETIEANTAAPSEGGKIVREGDGVWLKRRALDADSGPMRFLGVLDPWGI